MFHSSSLRFLQSTAPAPAAIAAKPHAAMLNAPVEGVGGFVGTGVGCLVCAFLMKLPLVNESLTSEFA